MENNMKTNLMALDRDVELLEESFAVLKRPIDSAIAPNIKNVKLFIRTRAEEFRNQIKLCLTILDRTLEFAENPESVRKLQIKLKNDLEAENETLSEIKSMYESEVKGGLLTCEKIWQSHHAEHYEELKDLLNAERQNLMKRQTGSSASAGNYAAEKFKPFKPEEKLEVHKSNSFEPHHHQAGEESKDFPLYSSSHEATYVRPVNLKPN